MRGKEKREREREKARVGAAGVEGKSFEGGGRYCYLRFIVITDGGGVEHLLFLSLRLSVSYPLQRLARAYSSGSNPERSYNHPPPSTSKLSLSLFLSPLHYLRAKLRHSEPTACALPPER